MWLKNNKSYSIVEIEFYFYSPNHRDFITYPRNTESGRWFFHQRGVDLSFNCIDIESRIDKNQKVTYKIKNTSCFGGILIRGIYHNSCGYIFGPQKCVDILWHDIDAFVVKSQDYPVLKKTKETCPTNIFQCQRYINIKGKDNQKSKIKDWAKRLGLAISDQEVDRYCEDLFDNSKKFRYRFFNLQNGDVPWSISKITSVSPPSKEETEYIE